MILVSPVILCGGSGTRLWPLSRVDSPKQFSLSSGSRSLFQSAVHRVNSSSATDIAVGDTLVVTNEDHRFLALDQLKGLGLSSAFLLLEPMGRNTAPALTLAALHATQDGADPVLVACAADHSIPNLDSFHAALQACIRCAASGSIVTMSIEADRPETGYGYVQRQGPSGIHGEWSVKRFVEKPDQETAQAYVASGEYAWNSGIFVLRAGLWLDALAHFRPDIHQSTRHAWGARSVEASFVRPHGERFKAVPAESIDYAVMEKCPGSAFPIKTVPLAAGWSDLGAWDAVWQQGAKDGDGNVVCGDTLLADTSNTLVHASSRLVGVVGVQGLVIVETADAVLVADSARSHAVGKLVAKLQNQGRTEHLLHRKTLRPWGWYDNIDQGEGFKVKRIRVNPGAMLSLQRHRQRSEHWVVVMGIAEVTCGDKTFVLRENESTFIPLGATHRLRNPGAQALEIIEVQTGSYLGEDDIERLEDAYGRAPSAQVKAP